MLEVEKEAKLTKLIRALCVRAVAVNSFGVLRTNTWWTHILYLLTAAWFHSISLYFVYEKFSLCYYVGLLTLPCGAHIITHTHALSSLVLLTWVGWHTKERLSSSSSSSDLYDQCAPYLACVTDSVRWLLWLRLWLWVRQQVVGVALCFFEHLFFRLTSHALLFPQRQTLLIRDHFYLQPSSGYELW